MTATHKFKANDPFEVTAWQFSTTAPIPVWVARTFHRLNSAPIWSQVSMDGVLVEANEGDWAVSLGGSIAVVLTDQEFQKHFEPLSKP